MSPNWNWKRKKIWCRKVFCSFWKWSCYNCIDSSLTLLILTPTDIREHFLAPRSQARLWKDQDKALEDFQSTGRPGPKQELSIAQAQMRSSQFLLNIPAGSGRLGRTLWSMKSILDSELIPDHFRAEWTLERGTGDRETSYKTIIIEVKGVVMRMPKTQNLVTN